MSNETLNGFACGPGHGVMPPLQSRKDGVDVHHDVRGKPRRSGAPVIDLNNVLVRL